MNKFLKPHQKSEFSKANDTSGHHFSHTPGDEPPKKTRNFRKLKIIFAICLLGTSFFLLLMHPFFSIRVLNVEGTGRVGESDLRATVEGILSYKKFFVLPQNNFFTVDIYDLKNILTEKYGLQKVTIGKKFPHTLDIVVEEKTSKVIYDNGKQYTLLDEIGTVREILRIVDDNEWREVRKMVSSTNEAGIEVQSEQIVSRFHVPQYQKITTEVGDYPLVYDTRSKPVAKEEQILEVETLQGILTWFSFIKTSNQIPFTYFYLDQELGDVIIKTSEGWVVKARLDQDIEKQFETLQYILTNKVQRPNLQYIDVRYIGRAYWL